MILNIQKTKFMVVGSGTEDEDLQPIVIARGEIENVKEFSYLGSLIAENRRIDAEVDQCIANASKAFRALHRPSSVQGCTPLYQHQEEGVPSLCLVSLDVWSLVENVGHL